MKYFLEVDGGQSSTTALIGDALSDARASVPSRDHKGAVVAAYDTIFANGCTTP